MSKEIMFKLELLAAEAESLASLAYTLDEVLTGSHSGAAGYAGAAHILAEQIGDHAQKLAALCETGEGAEADE